MAKRSTKTYNYMGFVGTAKDFEEKYGISASVFKQRVDVLGWDIGRAIHEPVNNISRKTSEFSYKCKGFFGTLPNIAKYFDVDYPTLLKEFNIHNKNESYLNNIVDKLIEEKNNKELLIKSKNMSNSNYKEILDENASEGNNVKNILDVNNDNSNSDNVKIVNKTQLKKNLSAVLEANILNNRVYNPILDWCIENHKNYNLIIDRIYLKGMTFQEATTIKAQLISDKNLIYKGKIVKAKTICNRYNLDYVEVYNLLCELYDFEYIIDTLRKKKNIV